MSSQKKLKIWNYISARRIRAFPDIKSPRVFVAAYSVKDIIALFEELGKCPPTASEVSRYWTRDAWEDHSMKVIVFERGIWVGDSNSYKQPIRLEKP
jgi:hypothetical protein